MDRREAAGAESTVWSTNRFSDKAVPLLPLRCRGRPLPGDTSAPKLDNMVDEIVNPVVEFRNG
jgi:hypothetical protein